MKDSTPDKCSSALSKYIGTPLTIIHKKEIVYIRTLVYLY